MSKLAVRGLTVAFASELATDLNRVNAIAPGLINTANTLVDVPQSMIDDIVGRQLIDRIGTEKDIVSAMPYLCSGEASFVTGETLKVCGGSPLTI